MGIRAYTVPEAATLLMKGGTDISMKNYSFGQRVKQQANLMMA
jgi:hypothetical protein